MEMGGPNSHGAVVAREYGIPAVVGVPDATARIRTGQQVTVDGAAGLVRSAELTIPRIRSRAGGASPGMAADLDPVADELYAPPRRVHGCA